MTESPLSKRDERRRARRIERESNAAIRGISIEAAEAHAAVEDNYKVAAAEAEAAGDHEAAASLYAAAEAAAARDIPEAWDTANRLYEATKRLYEATKESPRPAPLALAHERASSIYAAAANRIQKAAHAAELLEVELAYYGAANHLIELAGDAYLAAGVHEFASAALYYGNAGCSAAYYDGFDEAARLFTAAAEAAKAGKATLAAREAEAAAQIASTPRRQE